MTPDSTLNRAPTVNRRALIGATGSLFAVGLAGCSGDTDTSGNGEEEEDTGETVVAIGGEQRQSATFEAETGDEIEITIRHDRGGRTHVVVRSATGYSTLFSEGTMETDTWRVAIEETDTYVAELTPSDNSAGTSGSTEIVLFKGAARTDSPTTNTATDSDRSPVEQVEDWVDDQRPDIRSAQEAFTSAEESYEDTAYQTAEVEFEEAMEQFKEIQSLAARRTTNAPDDSKLENLYGVVSLYVQEMRYSGEEYSYASFLRQEDTSDELASTGRYGDADFWELEAMESFQKAEDFREEINNSLPNTDI